jgi:hypothetical protein
VAAIIFEDFEGAANGVNATASTTAFDAAFGTAGVITHSTLQSVSLTRSLRVNGSAFSSLRKNMSATGSLFTSCYVRLAATVPNSCFFISITDGTVNLVELGFNASDQFRLRTAQIQRATSSAVNIDQWYRVDLSVSGTTARVRAYTGATLHSTNTADAWWHSGAQTYGGGATMTELYAGNIAAVTGGWQSFIDYFGADTAALPDPYTPPAPAVPQGLVATTIDDDSIDLTWTAFPEATAYDIERDGVVITVDHPSNAALDAGLEPSTEYTYRVRGVMP